MKNVEKRFIFSTMVDRERLEATGCRGLQYFEEFKDDVNKFPEKFVNRVNALEKIGVYENIFMGVIRTCENSSADEYQWHQEHVFPLMRQIFAPLGERDNDFSILTWTLVPLEVFQNYDAEDPTLMTTGNTGGRNELG